MKKGYLIYNQFDAQKNKIFIDILIEKSSKLNIDLKLIVADNLELVLTNGQYLLKYNGCVLDKVDFVIQRSMNYQISKHIENMGIKVFNSSEVSFLSDNKFNTYSKIHSLNIPILDTYLKNSNDENNIFFPNVIKPVDSKGGDRVFYNKNLEEYKKNKKALNDKIFILQKVATDVGKDLRVYCIGKNIVVSILRISINGFLSNYSKGNNCEIYNLNEEQKKMIQNIIDSFDFDYVGIDFLFDKGKLVFNEIENVVGARMVYNLTNINIGEMFIEYISKKI